MKKIGIVFLLLIVAFSGYQEINAQSSKITWSPEFKEENGDRMGNVLYDDGTHVYMFVFNRAKGKKSLTPGIMKLDASMKPVQRQDFKASASESDDIFLMGVFYCGGKFVMLTHKQNKSSNTKTVYATAIDLATLSPGGEATEIWKISGQAKRDINMGYALSNDSNLFVLNVMMEQKDKEKQSFAFKVFDSSFKPVNEKKVTLNYDNEQYDLLDFVLTNAGNMSYFGKAYKGNPKKESARTESKEKEANYVISVLTYAADGTDKELKFEVGNKLLDNISAISDPVTSDIIMFVTYSNIKVGRLTEYETFRINSKDGTVISQKTHNFPKALIDKVKIMEANFSSDKTGTSLTRTFNIYDSKLLPDGRMYLVLQNDYSVTRTSSRSSYTMFYSHGIVVCLHEADGTLKWMNYIPKQQWYRNTEGFLYSTISYLDDKISIYYNDIEKNANYDFKTADNPPAKFNSLAEMNLMVVDITNEGKISRKKVYSNDKSGIPVMTTMSVQGKGNRLILYGETFRSKRNKIGVLNQ